MELVLLDAGRRGRRRSQHDSTQHDGLWLFSQLRQIRECDSFLNYIMKFMISVLALVKFTRCAQELLKYLPQELFPA